MLCFCVQTISRYLYIYILLNYLTCRIRLQLGNMTNLAIFNDCLVSKVLQDLGFQQFAFDLDWYQYLGQKLQFMQQCLVFFYLCIKDVFYTKYTTMFHFSINMCVQHCKKNKLPWLNSYLCKKCFIFCQFIRQYEWCEPISTGYNRWKITYH